MLISQTTEGSLLKVIKKKELYRIRSSAELADAIFVGSKIQRSLG